MPFTFVPIKPRGSILSRAKVQQAFTRAIRDTQAEGVRLMATYPPAHADSHYRRTGTLKRSWHAAAVKRTGNTLEGEIGSQGQIAPYNRKVQGEDQEAFFAGRGWPGVDKLKKLVQRQLPLRCQAEIDKAAGA